MSVKFTSTEAKILTWVRSGARYYNGRGVDLSIQDSGDYRVYGSYGIKAVEKLDKKGLVKITNRSLKWLSSETYFLEFRDKYRVR